jgi:hypothetical protein
MTLFYQYLDLFLSQKGQSCVAQWNKYSTFGGITNRRRRYI